jgi:Tol biopolymer transport system component
MAGGFTPVWSPDGRKIVFSNSELFTMRADGSRQTPVRPGFDAHHQDWQPLPKGARAEDDDD